LQWNDVRPYVSDRFYLAQSYWIDAYRRQGLRNTMDRAELERQVIAKIAIDTYYVAITVRIFASGCDYTIDQGDNVVGGSRTERRRYSEYWTLIRSLGSAQNAEEKVCPNCGGQNDVAMAAECRYCGAKVLSGVFPWILSRIEQDDVYLG
jgi:ribosomal protein L40E